VEVRTQLINHVRGIAKTHGVRIQKCNAEAFAKKAPTSLPEALRGVLAPELAVLEKVTEQIRVIERTLVKEMPERHPGMDVLQEVDCIGPITALTFILTIDDPKRFKSSREVGSYLGLCPRRRQSGDGDPELRITRCGDRYLRSLLVNCAQRMLGPFGRDSDLRRWGLALAARGKKNAKKRAVVAVARRLAVLLHRLLTTGEVWQPLGYRKQQAA
jgi:transposase